MIKNGYLYCPHCHKKIMPVSSDDVIRATLYCHYCKTYHRVTVADGRIITIERRDAV